MHDSFGVDDGSRTECDIAPRRSGRWQDSAVEQRRTERVKETSIQAVPLELAHGAGVAVREDRLGPIGRPQDLAKLRTDRPDCLVPGNAFKNAAPLRPDPAHWIGQALRMIDAIEIARHLRAEKAACERVFRIAAEVDGFAILDRHTHAARVGAIVRTDEVAEFVAWPT